jgi:glutamate N-acetyltransferase/amino-acid N-acetyltransferase
MAVAPDLARRRALPGGAAEMTARPHAATGAVTAARGFAAGAVHAGIRKAKLDLAVVRSLMPAVGAGMFTANRVQAAPVVVSKAHLAQAEPQAVVINSGIANAATGKQGELDAIATAAETAQLLGIDPEQVIVLSTGVIGAKLPMPKLMSGLAQIEVSPDGGGDAAEAIMTTDTFAKEAVVRRGGFTVGGMAKGAGMIHPYLATMLAVVTTDYPLVGDEAQSFLKRAVKESFNRISVDGDCSTNDAVILLANGESGVERTAATDAEFAAALGEVCADLAQQIVSDGEGATVLLEIEVTGAATAGEANAIARRIATSPLVKTAAFGRDPNWGRILAAAGSAFCAGGFAQLDVDQLELRMNGVVLFADGEPTEAEVPLESTTCRIELDLGLGGGSATYLASDLTYDYVRINAEYTT